jgi:hypothetical protein
MMLGAPAGRVGPTISWAACGLVEEREAMAEPCSRSGMSWTVSRRQVIVDLRVIWVSGIWDQVHQVVISM